MQELRAMVSRRVSTYSIIPHHPMEFSEIPRIKRTLRQVRGKITAFNTNSKTLRVNNNNNVDENYNQSLIKPFSFYILELWTRLLNDGIDACQQDVKSLSAIAAFSFVDDFPSFETDEDLQDEEDCYHRIPTEYRRYYVKLFSYSYIDSHSFSISQL
jgi:hypothetical protein